jgi:anti-sigma factor ChrR (cupin superfamily)
MRRQLREPEHSQHWSPLVSDYLDGELSAAESLGVAKHLWECQRCRALLHDFRAIVAAVKDLRQHVWIDRHAARCEPGCGLPYA